MKQIVAGFILVSIILFAGQQTAAETINMGYFHLPPHMYTVKGGDRPRGASIAYFETVAARMGYDVKWIGPLPLPRLIDYLVTGNKIYSEKLDGTIHFPRNDGMQKIFNYPDHPFYFMQSVFAVKIDNPLTEISVIDDVRDYRIGMHHVPVPTQFILSNRDKLHIERIPGAKWVKRNLRKLLAHRIEAIYDLNQFSIPFEALRLKLNERIKVLPLPEAPEGVYAVFAKTSSKGKIILKRYNYAVQNVKIDYLELVEKEFGIVAQKDEPQ